MSRVRTTQRKLKDALLRLMQVQPLNQITISQLTKEAGVHRSTYYYYYYLIEDVLGAIVDETMQQLQFAIKRPYENVKQIAINDEVLPSSVELFTHIYERKEYYALLLNKERGLVFQNRLVDVLFELFQTHFTPAVIHGGADWGEEQSMYSVYGILGLIKLWAEHDFQRTPQEMALQLTAILNTRLQIIETNL
ncbi:TetR family transcriptional regulator [Paenibacillus sp. 598K]|uniref:TetR-like C-terminal domain-containing protein n=1 Tax=Paenibacillus sp. 598K TaxID=1117987 RepID=UPI000FF980AD|nr:TetR-like C-terminal domain-containing protein [Paenibacillus sp. 598K]GBF75389.1 TetR family transcriptional regulator [Paenibacillus sp. 598K]